MQIVMRFEHLSNVSQTVTIHGIGRRLFTEARVVENRQLTCVLKLWLTWPIMRN